MVGVIVDVRCIPDGVAVGFCVSVGEADGEEIGVTVGILVGFGVGEVIVFFSGVFLLACCRLAVYQIPPVAIRRIKRKKLIMRYLAGKGRTERR